MKKVLQTILGVCVLVLRDANRGIMPRKVKGLGLRAWLKDSGCSSCRRLGGG